MISELRTASLSQAHVQGELKTKMSTIEEQWKTTDLKVEYLETHGASTDARLGVVDQMKDFLSQSEQRYNSLYSGFSTEMSAMKAQLSSLNSQMSNVGTSGGATGKKHSLIDPKVITLQTFD